VSQDLAQLHAAALALKPTIDTALAASGLSRLQSMTGRPDQTTRQLKPPRIVVGFEPQRGRRQPSTDEGVEETVTLTFDLRVKGDEATALAYEGVVKGVLRNAKATVRAAVTDAVVQRWELAAGEGGPDPDASNGEAWRAVLRVAVQMEW
jgi:hypothetical protein